MTTETCPRCQGDPDVDLRDDGVLTTLRECGVEPMTGDSHNLCCGIRRGRPVLSRNRLRTRNIGGKRGRNSGKVSQHGKKG